MEEYITSSKLYKCACFPVPTAIDIGDNTAKCLICYSTFEINSEASNEQQVSFDPLWQHIENYMNERWKVQQESRVKHESI